MSVALFLLLVMADLLPMQSLIADKPVAKGPVGLMERDRYTQQYYTLHISPLKRRNGSAIVEQAAPKNRVLRRGPKQLASCLARSLVFATLLKGVSMKCVLKSSLQSRVANIKPY